MNISLLLVYLLPSCPLFICNFEVGHISKVGDELYSRSTILMPSRRIDHRSTNSKILARTKKTTRRARPSVCHPSTRPMVLLSHTIQHPQSIPIHAGKARTKLDFRNRFAFLSMSSLSSRYPLRCKDSRLHYYATHS